MNSSTSYSKTGFNWGSQKKYEPKLTNIMNLKPVVVEYPTFHFGTGVTFHSTKSPKEPFEIYVYTPPTA